MAQWGPPYTYTFNSTFTGAVTWNLVLGTLPAGLSLSPSGTLAGTPTAPATSSFLLQASGGDQTAHNVYTITVDPATTPTTPTPSIPSTTTHLSPADVGQPYAASLTATGGSQPYTWSISQGQLPDGISLSSLGILSGSPTIEGNFSFALTVTDSNNQTASALFTLTIRGPLVITSTDPVTARINSAVSVLLSASGGTPPYVWAPAGPLPPGLTLSPSGLLSGKPTTAGSAIVTLSVHDSSSSSQPATATLQLQVDITAALAITTTVLPPAALNTPYSATLAASGGTAPYTWAVTVGQLPTGLLLSSSGTISGMPSAAGSFSFALIVTDSTGQTASGLLALNIRGPLVITSTDPVTARVNSAVSVLLSASGGTPPYVWAPAGPLPPGLTLSPSGLLSGKPTTAGSTIVTLSVHDSSSSSQPATATLQLQVDITAALAITTTVLPPAALNTPYSATLAASGGTAPYTWAVTVGQLPTGLSLSSSGTISGMPSAAGSFAFALTVTDSNNQTASALFTLIIRGPLVITSTDPVTARVNSAVSVLLSASGGTPPYVWAPAGPLPPGLTLSPSGLLSGKPTTAGSAIVTLSVHDSSSSSQPATATLQLQVDITAALAITTTVLPPAALNAPYSATLAASGGTAPYTWAVTVGQLPTGLLLSSSGTISGMPSAAGSFSFALTVTDSTGQTASGLLALNIRGPLVITSTDPVTARVNSAVSVLLSASGGTPPYVWAPAGPLPPGLTLSPSGLLSGKPTTAGSTIVTLSVHDSSSSSQPATATLQLQVDITAALAVSTTALSPATRNTAYSATFTATGGTAPYAWSLTDGQLPPGLALATGGSLSGSPTAIGSYRFSSLLQTPPAKRIRVRSRSPSVSRLLLRPGPLLPSPSQSPSILL